MDDLLDAFRRFGAIREEDGDVLRIAKQDSVAPTFGTGGIFHSFSPRLEAALDAVGIKSLYDHQEKAIYEVLISGNNVILEAPTASGKSLAFHLPVIEKLLRNPADRALMIYPMNALIVDQQEQLNRLLTKIPGQPLRSDLFIGSTSEMQRALIKENPPNILITNPEMLHLSLLAWSDQWQRFLPHLKWIVVDEVHEYRGFLGSSISMILRRLSYHLSALDVRPQFFLSSATCANPQEHAEGLTGLQFTAVSNSEGMRPARTYWFVQPAEAEVGPWEDLMHRAVSAGLACLACDKRVLVFCHTRTFAEKCLQLAQRRIAEADGNEANNQDLAGIDPNSIRVYRSGLSDDNRRAVQRGLQTGSVKLVFTTNALELGLDIGGLDGVILAGFPDNLMSAWQRIGRAGRRWDSEAFVLFLARNDPLDRFFANDPDAFLQQPLLDLVVNPANETLIERYMPSFLDESGDLDGDRTILGRVFANEAEKLLAEGAKTRRKGTSRPHSRVNVRGVRAGTFTLEVGAEEIGTIARQNQFREAFQNAIYLHGGEAYRVEAITTVEKDNRNRGGTIQLGDAPAHHRTDPRITTQLSENDAYAGYRWQVAKVAIKHGNVRVTEELRGVDEIDEQSKQLIKHWEPEFDTRLSSWAHAFWMEIEGHSRLMRHGLTALQNILRIGVIFTIPVDTHDTFAHSIAQDRTVYIVESYPGGIGIASKVLTRWQDCLEAGIKVAEACSCKQGCGNCIMPPRSREALDKVSGIALARELLKATAEPHSHRWDGDLWRLMDSSS